MFTNLVEAFKTKMNLGIIILIILTLFNVQQVNELKVGSGELLKKSTTEYAFTVIAYGLKDAQNEQDIIAQVITWRRDKWGAQIGAINTVCRVDPDRLNDLMERPTAVKACRLSGFT
ncbi:hypothetical protein VPHK225_0011 [Vibrio phage K225]|nr:hypothetical protein PODOV044v1_p0013 [Vibrio phage 23E28.1]QZI92078.1 hypothetical protein PODOV045v1_p0036 [Vibrio phage 69E27.1]